MSDQLNSNNTFELNVIHFIMAISKSKPAKKINYRDAESGEYVTKKYAEKHPKTTVKETDK
jgi:hypothetical protein